MDFISFINWVRAVRSEIEWFLQPWSLGSSDWRGSGAVFLLICPVLDNPMHCWGAAKIGKKITRECFSFLDIFILDERSYSDPSYKYYPWPCLALSGGLPPTTRRFGFWLSLFCSVSTEHIFPWPGAIFYEMVSYPGEERIEMFARWERSLSLSGFRRFCRGTKR